MRSRRNWAPLPRHPPTTCSPDFPQHFCLQLPRLLLPLRLPRTAVAVAGVVARMAGVEGARAADADLAGLVLLLPRVARLL